MKALCVKSYSELQQLVGGQVTSVEATLVEQLVADNSESGLQKLVPYLVFYNMDINAGKLKFIQYQRPSQVIEGTDERAPGQTSIGFGVPISNLNDIRAGDNIVTDSGDLSYTMSVGDVINTSINAAVREVEEKLGFKFLEVLGPIIDTNQTAFFVSENPSPEIVNRIGVAIPVAVSAEQFEAIRTQAKFQPEQIEKLDTLGINIDLIVEQLDITPTINQVIEELVSKHGLEQWSTMMFNYIARKELHEMLREINYQDIVALVHAKKAALQQIAQETARQLKAPEGAEVAQATEQAGEVEEQATNTTDAPAEEVREEVRSDQTQNAG